MAKERLGPPANSGRKSARGSLSAAPRSSRPQCNVDVRVLHWSITRVPPGPRPSEAGLRRWEAEVEDRIAVVARASTSAAQDSDPIASRVAVDEPAVSTLRDGLRHRGARVEFPWLVWIVLIVDTLQLLVTRWSNTRYRSSCPVM